MNKPKIKKLYVAIPSHDNRCHFGMTFGLLELYNTLSREGIILHPALHAKTSAARGRNNLFYDFLQTDAEKMLFADTDVVFKGMIPQLMRIIMSDKDIIGGLYPHKTKNLQFCVNVIPGQTPITSGPDMGLAKVDKIGTGVLCITRKAVLDIIQKNPHLAYIEDDKSSKGVKKWALCQETVVDDPQYGGPRWMTDDWYFCWLARKSGYDIWCDSTFYFKHEGDCIYPIEEPPTVDL